MDIRPAIDGGGSGRGLACLASLIHVDKRACQRPGGDLEGGEGGDAEGERQWRDDPDGGFRRGHVRQEPRAALEP